MKTIVFTLKEGHEDNTSLGWKRIELIPGMTMPHTIPARDGAPERNVQWQWCFKDGELDPIDENLISESTWGNDAGEDDLPYIITYEEARWL